LKEDYDSVPIMALTATATENVRSDVSTLLGLRDPALFSQSFNRENIFYEARPLMCAAVHGLPADTQAARAGAQEGHGGQGDGRHGLRVQRVPESGAAAA
jgi:superfamily II DNA helicase RecQ